MNELAMIYAPFVAFSALAVWWGYADETYDTMSISRRTYYALNCALLIPLAMLIITSLS